MENKTKYSLILVLLILIIISVNYSSLNGFVEKTFVKYETGVVERIVDGDTIKIKNESVRLLGINAPEKGEEFSPEAKSFLENKILGKEVKIYFGKDKYDLYKRKLGYIVLGTEDINKDMIENGFANFYFPEGKDQHYIDYYNSWNSCIQKNLNYCKSSEDKCAKCVFLKNLDVKNQEAIFGNNCSFSCNLNNWDIKDEGRKHFHFSNYNLGSGKEVVVKVGNQTNYGNVLYWSGYDYIWTKTGDTLFLRDDKNRLVLWYTY